MSQPDGAHAKHVVDLPVQAKMLKYTVCKWCFSELRLMLWNPFKFSQETASKLHRCAEDFYFSHWILEGLCCIQHTAHAWQDRDISITHHYWLECLAAGPAPWSSGQIDGRTATRLGLVSWTPLEWTHTQKQKHTHQSHCKRIISASRFWR